MRDQLTAISGVVLSGKNVWSYDCRQKAMDRWGWKSGVSREAERRDPEAKQARGSKSYDAGLVLRCLIFPLTDATQRIDGTCWGWATTLRARLQVERRGREEEEGRGCQVVCVGGLGGLLDVPFRCMHTQRAERLFCSRTLLVCTDTLSKNSRCSIAVRQCQSMGGGQAIGNRNRNRNRVGGSKESERGKQRIGRREGNGGASYDYLETTPDMSPETAGAQTTTRPCPSLPMIHLVRYVFVPSTPYLGAFLTRFLQAATNHPWIVPTLRLDAGRTSRRHLLRPVARWLPVPTPSHFRFDHHQMYLRKYCGRRLVPASLSCKPGMLPPTLPSCQVCFMMC